MRIFFLLLLLPLKILAQDIEGVWTGTIYNDTTKKYIPYEIAISENKGKLSGYSHTVFLDDKKEVTGLKSLKIKQKNSKVLIEDDDLIYNNYSEPPPKGVKQYSVLNVMQGDSGLLMVGVFNTNRTKEYASLTGTIHLLKKDKVKETKIIPKLDELRLSEALSFLQTKKANEQLAIAEKKKENNDLMKQASPKETANVLPNIQKPASTLTKNEDAGMQPRLIAIKENTVTHNADVVKGKNLSPDGTIKKEEAVVTKNSPPAVKETVSIATPKQLNVSDREPRKRQIIAEPQIQTPAAKKQVALVKDEKGASPALEPTPKQAVASVMQVNKTSVAANESLMKTKEKIRQPEISKKAEVIIVQQQNNLPIISAVQTPSPQSVIASNTTITSEKIAARKIETIKTVNFKSDSLTLTLYDNGVVDGDTVTVILNGKVIMPKQGLSTRAITKTIYVTPELGDSLQLIMYAENLGSIPPNTGLLIIQDGEDRYQIRFAGDLQKNSAIILKRNKLVKVQ